MNAIVYQTIAAALLVCLIGPWCLNRLADVLTYFLNRSDRKARMTHSMREGNL